MKRILCLLSILILASTYAKAQNAQEIIQNFLNVIEKNEVISYQTILNRVWIDKSITSDTCYSIFSYEANDTLIGASYNLKSGSEHRVYNGFDLFEYNPKYLGENIVKTSNKKDQPNDFMRMKILVDNVEGIVPHKVENTTFYYSSILILYRQIKMENLLDKVVLKGDTLVNGQQCWKILIDRKNYFFDKITFLPIYTKYSRYEGILDEYIYSDFKFNNISKELAFTKKAFPEEYEFSDTVQYSRGAPPINKVQAPEWELTNLKGEVKKIDDYKGKNLLLVFSLKGCPPCVEAMPYLDSLYKANKDINVCMIYTSNTLESIQSYQKQKPYSFEMFMGPKELSKKYQIQGFPTFYLIDKNGFIQFSVSGFGGGYSNNIFNAEIEKLPKYEIEKLPK